MDARDHDCHLPSVECNRTSHNVMKTTAAHEGSSVFAQNRRREHWLFAELQVGGKEN